MGTIGRAAFWLSSSSGGSQGQELRLKGPVGLTFSAWPLPSPLLLVEGLSVTPRQPCVASASVSWAESRAAALSLDPSD